MLLKKRLIIFIGITSMDILRRPKVGELLDDVQSRLHLLGVSLNGLADSVFPARIQRRETLAQMQEQRTLFLETWEQIKEKMEKAVGTDVLSEPGCYREVRFDQEKDQLVVINYDNNTAYKSVTGTRNYLNLEVYDLKEKESSSLKEQLVAYQKEHRLLNRLKLQHDIDVFNNQRVFQGVVIKENADGAIFIKDERRSSQENVTIWTTKKPDESVRSILRDCMGNPNTYRLINEFLTVVGLSGEQTTPADNMVMIRPILIGQLHAIFDKYGSLIPPKDGGGLGDTEIQNMNFFKRLRAAKMFRGR